MWNSTAIYWPNTLSDLLGHFFGTENGRTCSLPTQTGCPWVDSGNICHEQGFLGHLEPDCPHPSARQLPMGIMAELVGCASNRFYDCICSAGSFQLPVTSSQQFWGWPPAFPIPRSISYSLCAFGWVSVCLCASLWVAKLAAIRPNRACSAWLAGMDFPQLHWSGIPLWRLKLLDYFCWPSVGKSTLASYLPIIDVCRLSEIPVKTLALIKLLLSRLYFGVTQMIMYLCFQMETAVQLIWKLFG